MPSSDLNSLPPLPSLPLILASGSPRRKEILANLGFEFEVRPSGADESLAGVDASLAAQVLALRKAQDIAQKFPRARVLGFDTLVFCGERVLGKPATEHDAFEMLSLLNGKTHQVRTGVALCVGGRVLHNSQETTQVSFRTLTDAEIWDYVRTGEPMDKAGAYGAQKYGARLIRSVEGCFFNVVGLPIERTLTALNNVLA
jgi:septum formation protein